MWPFKKPKVTAVRAMIDLLDSDPDGWFPHPYENVLQHQDGVQFQTRGSWINLDDGEFHKITKRNDADQIIAAYNRWLARRIANPNGDTK